MPQTMRILAVRDCA